MATADLKEDIKSLIGSQLTYANIAAAVANKPLPQNGHTIIVSSNKKMDTSENFIQRVREAVDACNSGVCVEKVKKVKNQKVVVNCSTKQDLDLTRRGLPPISCLQ